MEWHAKMAYICCWHAKKKYTLPGTLPEGQSGGLVMLYKERIDLQLVHATPNIITGKFNNYLLNTSWYMSFIYGHPINSKRKILWSFLKDFRKTFDLPWVIWGYFDFILNFS